MAVTAIFGGTFNPFHNGHYEMLTALQNDESIDKILLLPDKIPPHKECDFFLSDSDRIAVCKMVAEHFGKVELCLIEFEREGKSYSYDTVKLLKERWDDDFRFVCGADMLVYFKNWYRYKDLMKELPFIVFRRSDVPEDTLMQAINELTGMGMQITLKSEIIPAVSSTEIRNGFAVSKGLMPDFIYEYIKRKTENAV